MNFSTKNPSPAKSALTYREQLFIMFLTTLITVASPFASDNYLPSLPIMTHVFAASANAMQFTLTIFLLGVAVSQLFYGPLSDKFGRRNLVLIGLSICLVGTLFCTIAFSITTILFGRLIQGIGAGVCNSLYRAIMRDIASGAQMAKINSLLGIAYAIAPAAAPIIGGYVGSAFGWRANFIFAFFFIGFILWAIWRYLPETNKQLNPNALKFSVIKHNYLSLLKSKIFVSYTICSSFALAGTIAYLTVSPFLFENILRLTQIQYGWLALSFCIAMMIGQLINVTLILRVGLRNMLLAGLSLCVCAGIAMYVLGATGFLNVPVILIPITFYIIGSGLVFSNATASAFQPFPHIAGSAGALFGCIQITGAFFASSIIAALPHNNQLALAKMLIFLGSSSIIILYLLVIREGKAIEFKT